jgi:hypothetical protein
MVCPSIENQYPKFNLKSLDPEFNPQIHKSHLIFFFVQNQFIFLLLLILWIVLNSNVYKKSPHFIPRFQKV